MTPDLIQEESENDFLNLTNAFFANFKPEHSVYILPLLVLSTVVFICIRYLIQSLINLCAFNQSSVQYMPQQSAIQIIQYFCPFTFELLNSNATYSGVECLLSCTEDCYVIPLWGVPIYKLFELLHQTEWNDLKEAFLNKTFQSACLSFDDYFVLQAKKKLKKTFIPPKLDMSAVETLPIPRLFYPFVLIMLSKHSHINSSPQLILLANVIHIPDKIVNLPSQLIHQFAKSANGPVAIIKKIYSRSFEKFNTGNENVELCIVCMHREIAIVIVPCGHACVCQACFDLCENCPICRGPKIFYFVSCIVSQH